MNDIVPPAAALASCEVVSDTRFEQTTRKSSKPNFVRDLNGGVRTSHLSRAVRSVLDAYDKASTSRETRATATQT